MSYCRGYNSISLGPHDPYRNTTSNTSIQENRLLLRMRIISPLRCHSDRTTAEDMSLKTSISIQCHRGLSMESQHLYWEHRFRYYHMCYENSARYLASLGGIRSYFWRDTSLSAQRKVPWCKVIIGTSTASQSEYWEQILGCYHIGYEHSARYSKPVGGSLIKFMKKLLGSSSRKNTLVEGDR